MQRKAVTSTKNLVHPVDVRGRLGDGQAVIMVAFGLVFWLVAALFIRLAPFGLFDRSAGTMMLFALTVPVACISVHVAERIATLEPDQLLPGVAVASASAMLCDGIGLLWWALYGEGDRLAGAAWLLWGVGLIIFAAFFDGRRRLSRAATDKVANAQMTRSETKPLKPPLRVASPGKHRE